ncbi:MAG: hypothetical protein JXR70_14015 [Spirochaetales bacterium]|nr:hypothetical protein [Spirochaetales bacterium]
MALISVNGMAQDAGELKPVDEIELQGKGLNSVDKKNDGSPGPLPGDEASDFEEIGNSEELSEELENLANQLLYFHIVVTMIPPGNKNAWTRQETRYTIPGKAVLVKLEGQTIKFDSSFVPYNTNNKYNLVAMSQIWMKTDNSDNMKFMSTFKMVTFSPGEKIFYYPLGLPKNEETPFYSIKIEIDIIPYLEYKAREVEKAQ